MVSQQERRKSSRLPFTPKVICSMGLGRVRTGKLRDISRTGCYLETDNLPAFHDRCELELVLNARASLLRISYITGRVVRLSQDGIAIRFDEPFDWISLVPICEPQVPKSGNTIPAGAVPATAEMEAAPAFSSEYPNN